MNIEQIRDESMRPDPMDEPPDEEDEEIELIEAPDLVLHCQRMKDGQKCERNGQCIRLLFNEGRYDICEELIIEDDDDTREDFPLDLGNN